MQSFSSKFEKAAAGGEKMQITPDEDGDSFGGERFRGKSEKGVEKSKVAAGNGPSIANQRLLQYVT